MKNNEEKYCNLSDDEQISKAMAVAARFVGYQMRSSAELKKRLERERFNHETICAVLDLFEKHGHINDLNYALVFIADKMRFSKFGRIRITYNLRQKGVAANIITAAYDIIICDPQKHIEWDNFEEAEFANATELLTQKYRSENIADSAILRKAADYLARRGYSRDLISKCIKMHLTNVAT